MERKVRVRFAPSPTGALHLGGVRTALFNYLFARHYGGDFLLRIEDTDQTRYVPGAEEYIIESLKWCGLKVDEGVGVGGEYGPYRQSERKEIYKKYALQLVESGNAYYSFDTAEELDAMRKECEGRGETFIYNATSRGKLKNSLNMDAGKVKQLLEAGVHYVIRFKMPEHEDLLLHDIIRGEVHFNSSLLDDKVLYKSDGMPTYHLANIVDDHLMKITHVIRGEEWLPSLPLHVLLYKAFGWEGTMPEFAHLPLILKPVGNGKLSKRDGNKMGFPVFPMEFTDPATGEAKTYYIYNEEDPTDGTKQYTMRSVSVNDALVLDETVLPHLKQNGDVDQALAAALAAAWENSSLSLSPNDTNTYNFKEYYTAMIGELGTYGDVFGSNATNLQQSLLTVDNQRQNVIGVSSDEELTYMIKYQNAYNASSRFINVINEMIEHLLTQLG